jgi:hypothetical protein
MSRAVGPVEHLIVVFEGNRFRGEVIPVLNVLLDSGLIRTIDLAVISKDSKDEDGQVTILESSELQAGVADVLVKLDAELTGIISEDQSIVAAVEFENNRTGAEMLFKNGWAAQFAQAIRNPYGHVSLD